MLQEQEGRGLLIPLLRSLGNVAAGGGTAAAEQLLSPDAAPALQALVTCAGVRTCSHASLGWLRHARTPGRCSGQRCPTCKRLPSQPLLAHRCPLPACFALQTRCRRCACCPSVGWLNARLGSQPASRPSPHPNPLSCLLC